MPTQPTQPEPGDQVPDATQPLDPATGATAPADPAPAGAAAPGGIPPRSPGRVRRVWEEVTSSTGGRVALAGVAVLATLLLVAVVGLGAALVGRHEGRGDVAGGRDGTSMGRDRGESGGGPWGKGDHEANGGGGPMGRDRQEGQSGRNGQGGPAVPGPQRRGTGPGTRPGLGAGGLGSGGALGGVLHGEFTTAVTGSPVVMVVQLGAVTAYTAGKSVTVKSSDGFEATYDLTGPVAPTRGGTAVAVGAQVRVLAVKDGLKATVLGVVG